MKLTALLVALALLTGFALHVPGTASAYSSTVDFGIDDDFGIDNVYISAPYSPTFTLEDDEVDSGGKTTDLLAWWSSASIAVDISIPDYDNLTIPAVQPLGENEYEVPEITYGNFSTENFTMTLKIKGVISCDLSVTGGATSSQTAVEWDSPEPQEISIKSRSGTTGGEDVNLTFTNIKYTLWLAVDVNGTVPFLGDVDSNIIDYQEAGNQTGSPSSFSTILTLGEYTGDKSVSSSIADMWWVFVVIAFVCFLMVVLAFRAGRGKARAPADDSADTKATEKTDTKVGKKKEKSPSSEDKDTK